MYRVAGRHRSEPKPSRRPWTRNPDRLVFFAGALGTTVVIAYLATAGDVFNPKIAALAVIAGAVAVLAIPPHWRPRS